MTGFKNLMGCCCGDLSCDAHDSTLSVSMPTSMGVYQIGPDDTSWTTITVELTAAVISSSLYALTVQIDTTDGTALFDVSSLSGGQSKQTYQSPNDSTSAISSPPLLPGNYDLKIEGVRPANDNLLRAIEWKFYLDGVLQETHGALTTGPTVHPIDNYCPTSIQTVNGGVSLTASIS